MQSQSQIENANSSFYKGVLPKDKLKKIEELQSQDQTVAMVGDGVRILAL